MLKDKYCITSKIMGEAKGLEKELRVLNRLLTWHDGVGVSYEADPPSGAKTHRRDWSKKYEASVHTGDK